MITVKKNSRKIQFTFLEMASFDILDETIEFEFECSRGASFGSFMLNVIKIFKGSICILKLDTVSNSALFEVI